MIQPLHDYVLIRRKPEVATTESGIIIPEQAREKEPKAEVVAVGPGPALDTGVRLTIDLKPGDEVIIGKFAGGAIVELDGGEEGLLVRWAEIMAVVR